MRSSLLLTQVSGRQESKREPFAHALSFSFLSEKPNAGAKRCAAKRVPLQGLVGVLSRLVPRG